MCVQTVILEVIKGEDVASDACLLTLNSRFVYETNSALHIGELVSCKSIERQAVLHSDWMLGPLIYVISEFKLWAVFKLMQSQ